MGHRDMTEQQKAVHIGLDYVASIMAETDGLGTVTNEEVDAVVKNTLEWLRAKCTNCDMTREDHIEREPEYSVCNWFTAGRVKQEPTGL